MNKVIEIQSLITKLNQYRKEYYTLDNPTVSDETYDKLYDKLSELEKETGLYYSNSPTQSVGYEVKKELSKITHKYPLRSLDKTKDINVLNKFLKGRTGILMHKLDGLTNELVYKNGKLIEASTRGNGEIGEDILHNVKTYTNIPLEIPFKGELRVIGEAIITYDIFEEINSKMPLDKQYKNPRNLVAGSVRQLDSKICSNRKVKFIAYNLNGIDIATKVLQLEFLEKQGFEVVEFCSANSGLIDESVLGYLKNKSVINKLPIDGLVLTHNDITYGKSLGETSHHPLHSLVIKFQDDVEITTLKKVEWQVGRTGVITPVAMFEPVELCGTTVNKASVHNISILKELQLGYGDELAVIKANEIIPQVQDNLTKSNTIEIPSVCPVCNGSTEVVKSENAEFLHCTNNNCKAKSIQKISHYCSRNAMNIVGLSEATIEKFIEQGFITDILDLYYLDRFKKDIIRLDGFGLKSYNNLIKSIGESTKCKLANFIFALGIPQVGLSTAKDLANKYTVIENLFKVDKRSLMSIEGIGNVVAREIYMYFNNEYNRDLIKEIAKHLEFVFDVEKEVVAKYNPLKGMKVYPTGKFNLKKDELKSKIESLGAIVESGYKKSLDYLICGGDTSKSGKVAKAEKDGVKLMTEEELMNLING